MAVVMKPICLSSPVRYFCSGADWAATRLLDLCAGEDLDAVHRLDVPVDLAGDLDDSGANLRRDRSGLTYQNRVVRDDTAVKLAIDQDRPRVSEVALEDEVRIQRRGKRDRIGSARLRRGGLTGRSLALLRVARGSFSLGRLRGFLRRG